jgi:endonuclease/exonuclease/phosphatase (EEP) superfamily protein YafD
LFSFLFGSFFGFIRLSGNGIWKRLSFFMAFQISEPRLRSAVGNAMVRRLGKMVALMASGLLLVVAAANGAGYEQGLVGHLAHFPLHCGVGSLLLSLLLVRMSIPRWAACLALIVGVGFLIQVAWLWNPPHEPAAPSNGPSLLLLTFNVYHANQHYPQVIDALHKASPDVLYLTEVTPDWHRAIASLRSQWPYRMGDGSNVLLSRYPLENTRSVPMTLDRAKAANGYPGDPILPLTEEPALGSDHRWVLADISW